MICEKIEPLLYLKEKELSESEKLMVSEHLKTCSSCRMLAKKIAVSNDIVRKMVNIRVETDIPALVKRTVKRIREENRAQNRKTLNGMTERVIRQVRWGLSVAALFLLILYFSQISGHGNLPEAFTQHPLSGSVASRENILENLPDAGRLYDNNVEEWIRNLSVENFTPNPFERVILEKYGNHILNNAMVRR